MPNCTLQPKVIFKELHTDGNSRDFAIWKSGEPVNLKGI